MDSLEPVVDQLWSEFQVIVHKLNLLMLLFMRLFDVEYGHGISPFGIYLIINMILGLNWNNYLPQRLWMPRIILNRLCVTLKVIGGVNKGGT